MLRIGIFFGGPSREREISFAGGRTVFENLDRALFEPVPVFVDSLGNFIYIDGQYIYKDSIRDFYPPNQLNRYSGNFKVYVESLGELSDNELIRLISIVGQNIRPADFRTYFDMAFIALHGPHGEDGSLQGLMEWHGIPYTGTGVFGSAVGIDKTLQNELMAYVTGQQKKTMTLRRTDWKKEERSRVFAQVKATLGLPVVVKAPHQGSSIGVAIVKEDSTEAFAQAVNQCFFTTEITKSQWTRLSAKDKKLLLDSIVNLDEGIGMPLVFETDSGFSMDKGSIVFNHPEELYNKLEEYFSYSVKNAILSSVHAETEILMEEFIEGMEFSCGVIQDEDGQPVPLPPMGIEKVAEVFDFKSKYKTGATRKSLPANVSLDALRLIQQRCSDVFSRLRFGVCARIDGFVTPDGRVLLHDPNTIPGMSPTSLIFKQMLEIGLNPSQAITYFIRSSLQERLRTGKNTFFLQTMLEELDRNIARVVEAYSQRIRIAVLFGGFTRRQEESLQRARQMYARLASSGKYLPVPLLLTGSKEKHVLHLLPASLMFKENVEDIRKAIFAEPHPLIVENAARAASLREKYAGHQLHEPLHTTYALLATQVNTVFVASDELSPSDDYSVQNALREVGLSFSGPGIMEEFEWYNS
jgi:D-alanine-D-alanine ligase